MGRSWGGWGCPKRKLLLHVFNCVCIACGVASRFCACIAFLCRGQSLSKFKLTCLKLKLRFVELRPRFPSFCLAGGGFGRSREGV